ncbi:hypothetical protein NAH03_23295, partial [Stenotrophomonas maltophilia]|uniref:hypothetical protein n=1 Tax=Stenotrophomonas maltophilia TaxID=40324 RepID=UPI0022565DD3|nr:hypothetical protein [Stenotrophomonas maltophilia]
RSKREAAGRGLPDRGGIAGSSEGRHPWPRPPPLGGESGWLGLGTPLPDGRRQEGYQEGLIEAWATLYRRYAQAIDATDRDDRAFLQDFWYPDVEAGLHGVYWVEQCVKSADAGSQWVDFTLP